MAKTAKTVKKIECEFAITYLQFYVSYCIGIKEIEIKY